MSSEEIFEPQGEINVVSDSPAYVAAVSVDEEDTGIQLQIWETDAAQYVIIAVQADQVIPMDLVDSLEEAQSRIRTVLESLGAQADSESE